MKTGFLVPLNIPTHLPICLRVAFLGFSFRFSKMKGDLPKLSEPSLDLISLTGLPSPLPCKSTVAQKGMWQQRRLKQQGCPREVGVGSPHAWCLSQVMYPDKLVQERSLCQMLEGKKGDSYHTMSSLWNRGQRLRTQLRRTLRLSSCLLTP